MRGAGSPAPATGQATRVPRPQVRVADRHRVPARPRGAGVVGQIQRATSPSVCVVGARTPPGPGPLPVSAQPSPRGTRLGCTPPRAQPAQGKGLLHRVCPPFFVITGGSVPAVFSYANVHKRAVGYGPTRWTWCCACPRGRPPVSRGTGMDRQSDTGRISVSNTVWLSSGIALVDPECAPPLF